MNAATLAPELEERERAARARLAPLAAEYPFTPRFHAQPLGRATVFQHYIDEGPRDGAEATLFVHGNPTWSFAFRRALRVLSAERRCVAVDHVGCGLSDKPSDFHYTLAAHVANLERLVLALDLARIHLVVHDWGGPIGLGFARRHPARIARLTITNTAAFALAGALPLRLSACRWPVFGTLAIRGFNAFARAATWMAVERPLAPLVKRGYLLPYDSWASRVATHEFVRDIPLAAGDAAFEELAAIERDLALFRGVPVQFLWGARDFVFTPKFLSAWRLHFPQAAATSWEDAGHYLFEDRAADFVAALRAFEGR